MDFFGSVVAQDSGLDGSSVSDGFIRVDGTVGFFAVEEVLQELDNFGDTGGSSDKDDIVNLVFGHSGIFQDFFDGGNAVFEEGEAEFFEFGSGDHTVEVFGFGEGVDFDGGLSGGGENSLSFFALSSQSSHGSLVISNINTFLFQEIGTAIFHQLVVEIFTSQVSVTGGGFDFEDTFFDGQEGHVESTSSQVEDEHVSFSLAFLVKTIGDGGGSGLVDDSHDIHAGNGSSVFGGLSLRVIEVGGDSNDCVLNGLGQISFGSFFHLDQHHSGDFFSVERFIFTFVFNNHLGLSIGGSFNLERPQFHIFLNNIFIEFTANQTLGIKNSVFRISGSLILGSVTDQTFSLSETNVGGGGSVTLVVGNNFHTVILENTDAGVGGT